MTIVCFIRYEIDPFQREERYTDNWNGIIPRDNFAMAQSKRFILREERTFLELAAGSFNLPSTFTREGER